MADYSDIFNQYLNNRFNQAEPQMTAQPQDLSTGTMVPPAVGPTIAASQGQQPANPLNQVTGAVAPQTMEQPPMAQTAMAQPTQAPEPVVQPPAMAQPTQAPEPVVQPPAMAQPSIAQPAVPVTGAVNPDYASYIGKNESGNNANIGYHNPTLSTAYGQYGITAPAYKDIQKTDPYFAGKDITSLSAEDQKRALDVFTANSAKALQNYGIEPTQGNLAGAHFLGPKGLNDYLTKNYISPAAAQANGGEARVRHIVDQRLKLNPAAASGATNQAITPEQAATQPGPGVPTYAGVPEQTTAEALQTKYDQMNKDDPIAIMALTRDENPAIASAAKARAYDLLKTGNMTLDAKSKVDDALANGQIPKYNEKTEEGSYIKAYLFARLGLNDLALQEQQKISPSKQTMGVMLGDQHYAATFTKDGQLLYAYDENGNKVNDALKAKLAANAFATKGAVTGQTMGFDKNGNTISHTVLANGQGVRWKNETTGQMLPGAPEGYHTGKDQRSALADQAGKQAASKMEAENIKSISQGAGPKHSQQQIQQAFNEARDRVLGVQPSTEMPGAAPAPTVAPTAGVTAQPMPTAAPSAAPVAGISPELETAAQEVYAGRQAMPTGTGANNYRNRAIIDRVNQLAQQSGKPYDPNVFKMTQQTEKAFNTGKQGDTVKSMNVAIDHLDTLQTAANALNNGKLPIFNDIALKFAKNTGQPQITDFNSLKSIVGSEVAKAVAGGATALGDREEIRKEIDAANSPAQLAGVIEKYQKLLGGQLNGLETQYKSGGGQYWDSKLDARTVEVLSRGKKESNTIPGTNVSRDAVAAEIARRKALKGQQ